jgi:hypothetical protein
MVPSGIREMAAVQLEAVKSELARRTMREAS